MIIIRKAGGIFSVKILVVYYAFIIQHQFRYSDRYKWCSVEHKVYPLIKLYCSCSFNSGRGKMQHFQTGQNMDWKINLLRSCFSYISRKTKNQSQNWEKLIKNIKISLWNTNGLENKVYILKTSLHADLCRCCYTNSMVLVRSTGIRSFSLLKSFFHFCNTPPSATESDV